MQGEASAEIWELKHNGVLIPQYTPAGLSIRYRGRKIKLTPEQEEMAVAWVKKLGTAYAEDPVFARNFFKDFSKALGLEEPAKIGSFDFSEIRAWLEQEKARREKLTREERKELAEARKRDREEKREAYGFAIINGERVEVSNYSVEPPGIFMGRGKHPLRGRWKPGVHYSDIILNLSPESPTPSVPNGSKWGGRVFDPRALWIAKWRDKLTGKMKYVWISESAELRQLREREKYDLARKLEDHIDRVREHIWRNLTADDELRRKVATVAYLIDALKLRVGDEKDRDEANTVGATTLRGTHVKIGAGGQVTFDFLGKDSVRWVRTTRLPEGVIRNLRSFITAPRKQIFEGVRSELVNAFLSETMPGLTAKVFRTYHATKIVEEFLRDQRIQPRASQIVKRFVATEANLRAAIECNHKRKLPKNWRESITKRALRVRVLKQRFSELRRRFLENRKKQREKFEEKLGVREMRLKSLRERLNELKCKPLSPARRRILRRLRKRIRVEKERQAVLKKSFWTKRKASELRYLQRISKLHEQIQAARLKLKLAKRTKNYNLGTSLKSYIDPRIFVYWAKKLNYDWKDLYPKTLQKKFSWVEHSPEFQKT
jgi:DNA topoisomerase-1